MNRTTITDRDTGEVLGWFDLDRATCVAEEGTRWDGQNQVGLDSGVPVQFARVQLWRTARGRWVLHRDLSRFHDGPNTWSDIDVDAAREWLIRQGRDEELAEHFPETPDEGEFDPHRAGREQTHGRPEVGPQVVVRMPEWLRDAIDEAAATEGVTRAEWIRGTLWAAINKSEGS